MKRFLVTILEGPEPKQGRDLAVYELDAEDLAAARMQGLARYKHQHPSNQLDFHARARPVTP